MITSKKSLIARKKENRAINMTAPARKYKTILASPICSRAATTPKKYIP